MTDRTIHDRASTLFLELRDLSPADRAGRLASIADAALRAEVASLLEHDSPDSSPSDPDALPSRIGPYAVVRRIGRGGSGVVLLAEQSEPVRRRVAIKIVPYAAVSPDLAARFEFERRALERTEHPNIAKILDAGRTPDGLPYIVLEFVEGLPISLFCSDRNLPLRDRIGLVLQVAGAVQHAHQRGVIHRDLKPANILVSETSGRATPRILDFGIAKPTDSAFDFDSPRTSGLPVGTPAYMAPEQTGTRPVDTRADVYALGAILYELTCGRPPTETTGDPLALLRALRETPPPPASRLRPSNAPPAPAWLLADLDCILAKALEKDPDRRYPTADAFADDLSRLLRREPIDARPPTLRYRAARFAQRNRALVAAAIVTSLAAAVAIAGLTIGLLEAQRQRREAINQSQAQIEINRFLTDDLLAAASPEEHGKNTSALDLLRLASARVDGRFPGRPLIAAAIHHTLGLSYSELGEYDQADSHFSKAIELRTAHTGPDAPDTVRSEIGAATLLAHRQKLPEAEAALRRAAQRARLILGPDDPALYTALNDLAYTLSTLDRSAEAVEIYKEALAGRARLLGPNDPQVLITTSNLAMGYEGLGQVERSLELQLEALRIAESTREQHRMTVIGLCNNVGATLQDLDRDAEAAPYLRKAAAYAADWLGDESPATLTIKTNLAGLEAELGDPMRGAELYDSIVQARTKLVGPDAFDTYVARYGYWNSYRLAKKSTEAVAGFSQLLADISRGSLGPDHWLANQSRVALARVHDDAGRPDLALPYARDAAQKFLAMYGPDNPRTRTATDLLKKLEAASPP